MENTKEQRRLLMEFIHKVNGNLLAFPHLQLKTDLIDDFLEERNETKALNQLLQDFRDWDRNWQLYDTKQMMFTTESNIETPEQFLAKLKEKYNVSFKSDVENCKE